MARASAAVAAQTAQDVLDAGTELFTSRGFAEVSLADVAQHAGVTRGAVYHHYGSKAGLLRAAAARLQAGVATAVVAAAESEDSPAGRLRAGCHAFLEAITAAPAARILLVDAPAVIGWAQWRELDAQSSAPHLREALADIGVPDALLGAMTAHLSGAMNEAALWVAEQSRTGPQAGDEARAAAHRTLDQLLDAVLPPPSMGRTSPSSTP